jgi:hypothetical protein
VEKQFTFDNRLESLYPALQDMISFIRTATSDTDRRKVTERSKIVLTELLTNGIKHAGNASTLIYVSVQDNILNLIKSDHGKVFLPQYTGKPGAGKKIVIASDPMSELFVIHEEKNRLKFGVQEYPITAEFKVSGLVEHYGLLMITKASDQFYYDYIPDSACNIFHSVLFLA